MTNSKRDWWKQQRAKGFARFFWSYGILKLGLWYGVLMVILNILTLNDHFKPVELVLLFAFYVLGFGGAMSVYFWRKYEKDFKKSSGGD